MSKEEIPIKETLRNHYRFKRMFSVLKNKMGDKVYRCGELHNDILDAMDEYAKSEAIAFAEWVCNGAFLPSSKGIWYKHFGMPEYIHYTTSQLYDLYLKSKRQ